MTESKVNSRLCGIHYNCAQSALRKSAPFIYISIILCSIMLSRDVI